MRTEEKIIETLLDEGTGFKIHVTSPLLLKWLGIKTIKFRLTNLYSGTLYILSPKLIQLKVPGLDLQTVIKSMETNIPLQAEILAIAILNNPFKIFLFKRILKRFLLWNLDESSVSQLTTVMLDKANFMAFMTSIVSTGGLQILKKETSLEGDTEEIIAPGSLSDQSSNITDSPGGK